MKLEFWTIAYRPRGEKLLLEETVRPFRTISNTWRYWAADPHLFEHEGKTWVFAELYDRVLRRGVIGCCYLTEDGASPWRVALKMPFHLSYPHIFRREGGIYMIPESYVGKEIGLYKAVEFPYRWERVRPLRSDIITVDTTLLPWQDQTWLLTQQEAEAGGNLVLMTENCEKSWTVSEHDPLTRPAGPVFLHEAGLLRPAQNCADGYGRALRFNRVDKVGEGCYQETLIAEIRPEQIASNLKFEAQGIHTYGQSEKYEIIDLKGFERDVLAVIMRPIWYIWRRLKRIVRK